MPIRYAIQPDLDLLLYIFEGDCTGREYLDIYHSIYLDKHRHHGMKVLMDLTNAALDFDTQDLTEATAIVVKNREGGFPPGHVAILSKGTTMRFLRDTLVFLADNVTMYLEVFNNVYDAVRWLGLTEMEKRTMNFREVCLQGRE